MTTLPLADRRTALYRLVAADGTLLYAGISWNPKRRINNHRTGKTWWPEVNHTTTAWFRNRAIALRHEARVIDEEQPRYNIAQPNPESVFAPKPKLTFRAEASRMSYGHAAAVLRMPADLLRKATEAGHVPHSCWGNAVWFTPQNIQHIRALFTPRLRPDSPYYRFIADAISSKDRRRAKRAFWLRHCMHVA